MGMMIQVIEKVKGEMTMKRRLSFGARAHVCDVEVVSDVERRNVGPHSPYTQQLNGVSEIKNRHLVEPLVAIMSEYQLPKYLWGYLLGGVTYTMNRLYASRIGMSPYEALYGKKPDLSNLRALWCQCWPLIPKEKQATKLDPQMDEAPFIAYEEGDSYVLYKIRTKKIVRSRHVIFNVSTSDTYEEAYVPGHHLHAPRDLPDPAYNLNVADMGSRPKDSLLFIVMSPLTF
ncbi:hypothetical protein N7535_003136 [Penicillium sp. DV-2018c]|nr:hypothetical protein N7461_001172 [Penicillium sp. DV-2018c]KAJ5576210.1 hypothetical protein N7535_003136 [Penicillium sp. DV-2018c]